MSFLVATGDGGSFTVITCFRLRAGVRLTEDSGSSAEKKLFSGKFIFPMFIREECTVTGPGFCPNVRLLSYV